MMALDESQRDETGLPEGAQEEADGSVRLPLVGGSISAHGEELTELLLRKPTVKQLIATGTPFLFVQAPGGGTGTTIVQPVVAQYVQRLARVPPSAVESLSMADYSRATTVVLYFFGQAQGQAPSKG